MADAESSPSAGPAGESPAQKQARLRRERRAAKIQAGGASRLQAISQLQGGTHRDVEKDVPVRPSPGASPRPSYTSTAGGTSTPDPDEIDISEHHYAPTTQPRLPSPFAFNGTETPPFGFPPPGGPGTDGQPDPMIAMMQQMLGGGAGGMPGMPGGPGQSGPLGDFPPGLANMFQAMSGSGSSPQPSPTQSSAWIWRLVHSVFSLFLAVYIVFKTPFDGSKLSRTNASPSEDWTIDSSSTAEAFKHFFYMFATFEVVLQSSRYFIERGQLQGGGILSSIGAMLPEPYGGYVRVIGRYSVIYRTVVNDAMVVVFVLGAASWWRGGIIS
ncbi:hypothetical protein BCR34DRAFT_621320 [Clohesyomyces aquaticus]|uniref:GET complex, subunit GET2 n=1 Tax=Clohesyomyces aquaticus TaxID=1231657 RepID=A0A1Y2A945_9PLEO|nr:hypothetical protein BCR34DRAFT_621320 [Clohesyomyces aquaticus]